MSGGPAPKKVGIRRRRMRVAGFTKQDVNDAIGSKLGMKQEITGVHWCGNQMLATCDLMENCGVFCAVHGGWQKYCIGVHGGIQ
eukprot:6934019-Karenia_brevis.AAC.1